MDPTLVLAGSQLLASVLKPPAAAPAISGGSNTLAQDFDFSGFTVATGGSKATGAPNNKTTNTGAPATSGGADLYDSLTGGTGSGGLTWLIVGGAALAAVMLWPR